MTAILAEAGNHFGFRQLVQHEIARRNRLWGWLVLFWLLLRILGSGTEKRRWRGGGWGGDRGRSSCGLRMAECGLGLAESLPAPDGIGAVLLAPDLFQFVQFGAHGAGQRGVQRGRPLLGKEKLGKDRENELMRTSRWKTTRVELVECWNREPESSWRLQLKKDNYCETLNKNHPE